MGQSFAIVIRTYSRIGFILVQSILSEGLRNLWTRNKNKGDLGWSDSTRREVWTLYH